MDPSNPKGIIVEQINARICRKRLKKICGAGIRNCHEIHIIDGEHIHYPALQVFLDAKVSPLYPTKMPESYIAALLEEGYFLLKIELGSDPDDDGDQDKILKWDCGQLSGIHELASRYSTPYTENGKLPIILTPKTDMKRRKHS